LASEPQVIPQYGAADACVAAAGMTAARTTPTTASLWSKRFIADPFLKANRGCVNRSSTQKTRWAGPWLTQR
jgi:hypothetical protein